MKFGKRLQDEIVPEWADYYINYKRLKQFIQASELRGNEFYNELFKIIREELQKAEGLFQDLLDELQQGEDQLLALDPDQPGPLPKMSSKFHRRRLRARAAKTPSEDTGLLTAGESSMYETAAPSEVGTEQPNKGVWDFFKNIFLTVIGDSQVARRNAETNTPRALFYEWYSNAHQLQHFAELNVEAIRKSAKKLKKHRKSEPDFTVAIEAELSRSRLTALMPRLHNMMSSVAAQFERKFQESLDPYASVALHQAWHAKWRYVFIAVFLFIVTMNLPVLSDHPPAHNCLALFVLVVVMWITEAIPFFCTAMLIPLFAVPLHIVKDPNTRQTATVTVASHVILGKVFNHVQILVMGGLTIGKALARTNLEMYAASALHRLTAHRPNLYLLGVMLASCVLCAFVSNVAAPLLVLGVIQRTLWELPEGTTAPQGILLGLAFACNLGGMLSPIASPQNAVAISSLGFHNVSFAAWVGVALPVTLLSVVAAWAVVLLVWKPFKEVPYIPLQVVNQEAVRKVSTADRVVVVVVSLVTVVLWVLPTDIFFGDTGIVALIPIVVFFGIGILSKEDFNTLSWHLLFLLAGGNMLGLCAHDSEMLDIVTFSMKDTLASSPPYLTLLVIIGVVGLVTTFVSHTVAAMIMLPIIVKIGFLLPPSEGFFAVTPQLLVMLSALMCSGAMAFPISSFPNVNSLLAEDEKGRPYLQAKDFLFCGTVVTVFFSLCCVTWMLPVTNLVLG